MPILRLRADAGRIPLADGSVHCVATSPPYFGLRKYAGVPETVWSGDLSHAHEWGPLERPGVAVRGNSPGGLSTSSLTNAERQDVVPRATTAGAFCACGAWRGCLGNEPTVDLYVAHMVECFREVRRVLRDDGVCWVVLGDSFAAGSRSSYDGDAKAPEARGGDFRAPSGIPSGNLLGVPWRVALALQADGWLLRNDVVWAKRATMPESVRGWSWQRCRVKVAGGKRGERMALTPAREESAQSDHDGHDFAPSAEWADCPGCAACAPNDGLVLRRGSWRHTRATESVFMLAKSMGYFCDAEAVAEQVSEASLARVAQESFSSQRGGDKDYALTVSRNRSERRVLENFAARAAAGTATRNPRSFTLLGPEPTGAVRRSRYEPVLPSEAGGGTARTASPDCPVHSPRAESGTTRTDGCGERPDHGLRRRGGNADHRAPEPCGADGATPRDYWASDDSNVLSRMQPDTTGSTVSSEDVGGPRRPGDTGCRNELPDDSSDLQALACAPPASDHSKESRRTGRVLGTSLSDTPSVGSPVGTARSRERLGLSDSAGRRHASSSEPDDPVDHPSAESASRISGRSSCTCLYLRHVVDSVAHYAAMPTALVEPLILASTSARGVCRACGAPWARVVERTSILERPKSRPGRGEQPSLRASLGQPQQGGRYVDSHALGWRAACACAAGEPVPATVLDPFAGSGTTGIVAVRHRRRAVLCDLSQTYLRDIADARTRGVQVELAL